MDKLRKEALNVAQLLRDAGYRCLYAGGCVRDRLRGLEPKDIDIATSATPAQVLEIFPKGDSIGAHFGVILVMSAGIPFEIATFREDGEYHDGRHPEGVYFSTPEKDAERRDFTINGLFEDPWSGEIIDYVGGQKDLELGLIRAIGDPKKRFEEDSLRLLRAIRFAVVTGFKIEEKTWVTLRDCSSWLSKVSVERIREEFVKIMTSPRRVHGLDLLMESGLMRYIIPGMYDTMGCEQPPNWHPEGDVYTHTKIMLDMLGEQDDVSLILAVLLHDIGKPPTYSVDEDTGRIRFSCHDSVGRNMSREIMRRLKFPNVIIDEVSEMVGNHMKFMHVQDMRPSRLRRFMGRPTFERELELHRVDCASSNGFTDNYEFLTEKLKEFATEPILPPPFVTGRDLIDRGMQPGPSFKIWLEAVQTEQLENNITTREDALRYLEGLIDGSIPIDPQHNII